MSQGWIQLHRQIQDSWLWNDKPYARGQAWVDLLLLANHKEKTIIFNGKPKVIQRGQLHTSLRKLGDRWGWEFRKVMRFLDDLEMEHMIAQKRNTEGNTITIVNYEVYQASMEHRTEYKRNTDGIQTINNKKIKNINKIPQYKKFSHSDEDSVLEQELLSN